MALNFKAWNSRRRNSKRFDLRREVEMRVGVNSKHQISKRGVKFAFVSALRFGAQNFIVARGYVKFYRLRDVLEGVKF